MNNFKIFGEGFEQSALDQFTSAMEQPFVVQGALMPDAHTGYSLPIGGVVATKDFVLPAWVGYDIGCGMLAVPTSFFKTAIQASATVGARMGSPPSCACFPSIKSACS